jgi:hypothetical protein
MKVTMLRAGDKIMQELVFSNFYSAVSNFFVPSPSYGVGDCLSSQLFGSSHKFLQVMLVYHANPSTSFHFCRFFSLQCKSSFYHLCSRQTMTGMVGFEFLSQYLKKRSKANLVQAWTGPEGSRRLRLPDFKTFST